MSGPSGTPCPICGHDEWQDWGRENGVDTIACVHCGQVQPGIVRCDPLAERQILAGLAASAKTPLSLEQLADVVASSIWSDCDADLPAAEALVAQIPRALGMIFPATLADVGESADPDDIGFIKAICEGFMFKGWLAACADRLVELGGENAIAVIKQEILSIANA